MKGDFSRSTFDPGKHYTSVRMQQGRVQLDADWNEQADILLHLITTQLHDLLGPGGAAPETGFAITCNKPSGQGQAGQPEQSTESVPDFQIGAGRYYVDGILCENEKDVSFSEQPDFPDAASRRKKLKDHDPFLVYLDVWQRHITAIEDPAIREIALGGPDTTTRVKTVWQVKLLQLSPDQADDQDWKALVPQAAGKGCLRAKWDKNEGPLENRLYRVEIHSVDGDKATFKWSRENGSIVFPLTHLELEKDQTKGQRLIVQVEGLRDLALLRRGDWVEIVDDTTVLNGTSRPLCQVLEPPEQVDRVARVALSVPRPPADDAILSFLSLDEPAKAFDQAEMALEEAEPLPDEAELLLDQAQPLLDEAKLRQRHAILRRWDHRETLATAQTTRDETTKVALAEGALVEVLIKNRNETWLALELGIEVCFDAGGQFQVGDYWLIPARARSKRGIEWPQEEDGKPRAQPPHGIVHHYAPLALLQFMEEEGKWQADDRRLKVDSLTDLKARLETRLAQVDVRLDEHKGRLAQIDVRLDEHKGSHDQLCHRVTVLEERQADFQAPLVQYFEIVNGVDTGHVVSVIPPDPSGELDSDLAVRLASADERDRRLVVGVVKDIVTGRENGPVCRVVVYGRAQCRVVGDIEPGDVLVPSAKLGYAQRAGRSPRPGTILGKALGSIMPDAEAREELEEGQRPGQNGRSKPTGTVDMMVMLR